MDYTSAGSPEPPNPLRLGTVTQKKTDRVTLQVGERRFTTLRDTLVGESEYFAARLSDRWSDCDEDGSYFIDSDPTLFSYILSYLRSGSLPVFFDSVTLTWDHAKYLTLLSEARYFGIEKLCVWIDKQQYLDVVTLEKTMEIIENVQKSESVNRILNHPFQGDRRLDISTTWSSRQAYVCPRGIPVHYDDQSKCGRACENARDDNDGKIDYEEIPVLKAVVTTTNVKVRTINH
ncbi:BTB/POZ protein [Hypoxylon trugodes]|uniref:BTB/POZ protein n=1 Tax=Hypoxylon trugodes TaxID=326681 RepID=UPI0021A21468|nr:BTB/POZ protein [Hypoxylon trugodes]KAI1388633.1 BTB/POZ protein [Hypoxylon trugodes]